MAYAEDPVMIEIFEIEFQNSSNQCLCKLLLILNYICSAEILLEEGAAAIFLASSLKMNVSFIGYVLVAILAHLVWSELICNPFQGMCEGIFLKLEMVWAKEETNF